MFESAAMGSSAYSLSPLAVLLIPVAVLLLALFAATANSVLDSRVEQHSWRAGLGVPLRETARLLRQRRRTILGADSLLWRIAGAGLLVVSLLKVVVIPIGTASFADIPVGLVWFNAMDVLLWALWWLLGWGANSAHSLIGGYRFLAQALSYEIPLMFALTAPAIGAASLRMTDVVAAQDHLWFIVWMPIAFLVYLAAVTAFSAWGPFSIPSGTDIAGGVVSELSGVDRLLVLAGRYMLLVSGAAFAVPLFLGGGNGPLLPAWLWVLVKTLLLLALLVWTRRWFPAIRPERLAEVAWVIVVPLILLQLLVVAIISTAMRG